MKKNGIDGNKEKQDIILIDWLTFTIKNSDVNFIMDLLGLPELKWELGVGRNCFKQKYYYEGISILFDGMYPVTDPDSHEVINLEDMGVCVDMSGKGCRTFETYSNKTLKDLLYEIVKYIDELTVSRIDIAFDDHSGCIDLNSIISSLHEHRYRSKFKEKSFEIVEHIGHIGQTVYMGSPSSNIRFRIYDKAFERGIEGEHWNRFEIQLRKEKALSFVHQFVFGDMTIGEMFSSVVNNYFTQINLDDTNISRCSVTEEWSFLINSVDVISLITRCDNEYNLKKVKNYLYKQTANSLLCVCNAQGVLKTLAEMVVEKRPYNKKYENIAKNTESIKLFLENYSKLAENFRIDDYEEIMV